MRLRGRQAGRTAGEGEGPPRSPPGSTVGPAQPSPPPPLPRIPPRSISSRQRKTRPEFFPQVSFSINLPAQQYGHHKKYPRGYSSPFVLPGVQLGFIGV